MVEDTTFSSSSDEDIEAAVDVDSTLEGATKTDDSSKSGKDASSRINELVGKSKAQEEELVRVKQELEAVKRAQVSPTGQTPTPADTPDGQKALAYLESLGFPTKKAVQEEIKALRDQIALDTEHGRLMSAYDGSDGRPQYDKTKVVQYGREHGIYDPEVAYKALHETELLDWHMKKANGGEQRQRPFVERPGSSGVNRTDPNAITKEKLQEVAANPTPVNREWYERNRLRILDMVAKGEV